MGYKMNTRNPRRRQKFSKKIKGSKRKVGKPAVKKMIDAAFNRNLETKSAVQSPTDGVEITHNNYVVLNGVLLATTQGIQDPENQVTECRIGDKITLKGVSIRMMIELNERYSDVTFRVMVIKYARGDVLNRTTMFKNQSGNKMLDSFNNERFTILAQKWCKITAPNTATVGAAAIGGEGYNTATDSNTVVSRATRIVKMWIPGTKFARNGVIQYVGGSSQVKFFEYALVVYAYSNFTTLQDVWNVGRINDSIVQLYFKDA